MGKCIGARPNSYHGPCRFMVAGEDDRDRSKRDGHGYFKILLIQRYRGITGQFLRRLNIHCHIISRESEIILQSAGSLHQGKLLASGQEAHRFVPSFFPNCSIQAHDFLQHYLYPDLIRSLAA